MQLCTPGWAREWEGHRVGSRDMVLCRVGTHDGFFPCRALLGCLGAVFLPTRVEQALSDQDGELPVAVLASVCLTLAFPWCWDGNQNQRMLGLGLRSSSSNLCSGGRTPPLHSQGTR